MVEYTELKDLALQFNDCITRRDLDSLVNLMADDHLFIDGDNNCIEGKSNNAINWQAFFKVFPDYKNVFEAIVTRASEVIIRGYSVCADDRLNMRAIWVAQIVSNKITEWRIYYDTKENRDSLGI